MRISSIAAKIVLGALATIGVAGFAIAADGENYYKGKTLTYIVATKPGGGYDTYARLIADHLPKYLPGVRVRIRNVPGAGDIIGTNQLARARPDGLTIGTFNSGLLYAQLSDAPGIQFDLREFEWIGKAAVVSRMLVAAKATEVSNLQELRARDKTLLFGANGVGSASYAESLLLAKILDIDIKLVTGMASADRQMSMIRGELAASLGSGTSFRRFVENGYGQLLLEIGGDDADVAPDVAAIFDSAEDRAIYELIRATANLGRMTAAPRGTPVARLDALRNAYAAVISDDAFRREAARRKLPIAYGDADYVQRSVADALDQESGVVRIVREATGR